jgi:hypothetical protein
MRTLMIALALVGCSEKSSDSGAVASEGRPVLEAPSSLDGFQLSMYGTAPPFSEVWLCSVYPLPVEAAGFTAVQSVEYNQNEGTHHFTLSALGFSLSGTETESPIEHGTYDCNELYSDSALMEEAVMVFGGQGEPQGEMVFPEGTVANVPATIDVLHEVHFVNPTPDEVEIYSEVNAYTVPQTAVEKSIWGGSVRDENIEIPPNSVHTEWSRCVFNEDVEVLLLAGHQHELGTRFDIANYNGETGEVGEVFFSNDDWHTPNITQYSTPLAMNAGQGFEWTCEWNNTTDETVVYGNDSTDEMCNMAVVFRPVEGMISMTAACEVVEASDGVLWEGR